jgi:hypothetical protein
MGMAGVGIALAAAVLAQNQTYQLQEGAPAPIVVHVGDVPGANAAILAVEYSYSDLPWGLWPSFQAMWFRTGAVNGAGVVDAEVVDRNTGAVLQASVLQLQPNAWVRWGFPQPVDSHAQWPAFEFQLRPQPGTDFEVDNLPVGNGQDMQRGIVQGWTQRILSSWLNYLDADGGTIGSSYAQTSQVYEAAGVNDPFSMCGPQPMVFGNPYVDVTEEPLDPSRPLGQSFALGAWESDVPPPVGVTDVRPSINNAQPFSWSLTAAGVPSEQGTGTWEVQPPFGFKLPDPDGGPVAFTLMVQALDAGATWTRLSIGEPGTDPCHPVVRATYGGALGRAIEDGGYGADYEFVFDDMAAVEVFTDGDRDGYGDRSKALWISANVGPFPPSGYALTGDDCDDTNPLVHPHAAEVCNGIDDNCDGLIDTADPTLQLPPCEFDAGVCANAIRPASTCVDGGVVTCPFDIYGPSFQRIESSCDGLDNDCNGFTDSADPSLVVPSCELDAGVCATAIRPRSTCTDAGWVACATSVYGPHFESPEVSCDGLDNDCNGITDDVTKGPLCTEQRGVCAGAHADLCSSPMWVACGPHEFGQHYEPVEVSCDGLDNDCDGLVDGDDPDLVVPACASRVGVCAGSLHSRTECTTTGWSPCTDTDYGPDFQQTETRCDGLDNDCDGLVDEGCIGPPQTAPAITSVSGPAASGGCSSASGATGLVVLLSLLRVRRRPTR